MGTRTGSHQLSNGLMVSGRSDPHLKDRQPTMASRVVIYTGGDVKKSGDLGRMYGIGDPPKLPTRHPSGSSRSGPNSVPLGPKHSNSGPIQPTGLITSGPQGVSNSNRRSGQLDTTSSFKKAIYGSAVTSIKEGVKLGFRVPRAAIWAFLVVVVMGIVVGAFLMAAVKKAVILVATVALLVPAVVMVVWNCVYMKCGVLGFVKKYDDTQLKDAVDGQYIKVTGVVTCGSIPLETSFQRVPRCAYVSTELFEYRGCGGKPANDKHRFFSWGCIHSETYVADFYISDFQSGSRALVKSGHGAKVAPFVKPAVVVDVTKDNKESSPNFLRWLSSRGLSGDDRLMRLQEGYIKEGSTVSVMGVVQRHDNNVVMIVPPTEPVSTGCRWLCCLLPTFIEGLILTSDQSPSGDVIPV
ncbi:hypothetical protein BUALT_Bualt18G0097500 [Buddleja alternifolia]|uniref:Ubiquitin-specific protease family C19-related protein n=1 Tax=Buddleja alternifolia TaxID=168488 RepID=A0AAV6W4G2_9LAMI|nr:hypothetical protein BUALT_Bualt18G0097500 [Buddleja alternifolia]